MQERGQRLETHAVTGGLQSRQHILNGSFDEDAAYQPKAFPAGVFSQHVPQRYQHQPATGPRLHCDPEPEGHDHTLVFLRLRFQLAYLAGQGLQLILQTRVRGLNLCRVISRYLPLRRGRLVPWSESLCGSLAFDEADADIAFGQSRGPA